MQSGRQLLQGILLVFFGAASYGVLATIVGLAYRDGYSTTEVVLAQYLIGLFIMGLIFILNKQSRDKSGDQYPKTEKDTRHTLLRLGLGGIAFGLTGYFYYWSVKYIPVSIAVVLLMQSIWIGIVLEAVFFTRKWPDLYKCIAVLLVLGGTILATNAINDLGNLSVKGIILGLCSGLTYAVMLLVMNMVATSMNPYRKSFLMLGFACTTVVCIGLFNLPGHFHAAIFGKWGLALAIFGPVLPTIFLNIGMPKTGVSLGSILVSIEIPVSVSMAHFFLSEHILPVQWVGIGIIILSIGLINLKLLRAELG